ncbi:hypothetical protein, partial [Dinoroseobacter shibae]|uniref:hypothetical protein n=1 Tax=Dinoroseobacter shibae TaxID=215813 RepID=UPI0030EF228B
MQVVMGMGRGSFVGAKVTLRGGKGKTRMDGGSGFAPRCARRPVDDALFLGAGRFGMVLRRAMRVAPAGGKPPAQIGR